MQKIDLAGHKFGSLSVLRRSETIRPSGAFWVCLCECGKSTEVDSLKLRAGHTKSCGCRRLDGLTNFKHGHSKAKSLTYRTWKEMRQRCTNPNATQFKWYGGRGIKIDPRWDSYETFLADMGERRGGMTLDRIDPDGDYTKQNCRWATAKEQAESNRGCIKKDSVPINKITQEKWDAVAKLRSSGHKLHEIYSLTGIHLQRRHLCLKLIRPFAPSCSRKHGTLDLGGSGDFS